MNIAVAQSGGPTAVINASLLGVYRAAKEWDEVETVFGSLNGIEGILNDNLVSLNSLLKTEEDEKLLRQTPSAALRSCRYKLPDPDKDVSVYEKIHDTFKKHDIGAFFYIGGNDSMDTVHKLSVYFSSVGSPIRVMGVPKTIDNDLNMMDHSPGYGSAAKFVAVSMAEMIRDCTVYELDNVLIVEAMGRDAGWLTAAAALPHLNGCDAPHLVYLREAKFTEEQFLSDVKEVMKKTRTVIVAISEGVELESFEQYRSGKADNFGHKYLSGIGKYLEELVREKLKCKVRSVELNILQRCASHIASETDLCEAEMLGALSLKAAARGETGKVSALVSRGEGEYAPKYDIVPIELVANQVKYFPREWINEAGNNLTPEALEYIRPLILGEPDIITENGIPKHFVI